MEPQYDDKMTKKESAPNTPSKKRKLNGTAAVEPRTIANFFGRPKEKEEIVQTVSNDHDHLLADEEFARQLQSLEDNQVADDEELARRLGSQEASEVVVPSSPIPETPRKISRAIQTSVDNSKIFELDLGSLTFNPHDHADLAASWGTKSTPYALLAHTFTQVNSTRSRLLIIEYLTNFLRMMIVYAPDCLLDSVWLCTNAIAPPYDNTELGLGGSIISKAIKNVSGCAGPTMKALWNKYGDMGDVAFEAKAKMRTLIAPKPLTIDAVYKALVDISKAKGNGSGDKKQKIVEKLLLSAKGEEVRYVARTLVFHLRIGAVKTTMLIALARAFTLNKPDTSTAELTDIAGFDKQAKTDIFKRSEEIIKLSFARKPNYNLLVPLLLQGGIEILLTSSEVEIGVPIKPMLGLITKDIGDMFSRLEGQEFTCEYKYDGQRAQIHYSEATGVHIFSRHLERMTDKYPDLCDLMLAVKGENVTSFVMEGEVVAWDKLLGMQNFQSLASRARKNVDALNVKQQVCLFAFDLMYLNEESLLNKSLRERRTLLKSSFRIEEGRFGYVQSIDYPDHTDEEVQKFFQNALEAKCEGIMVKLLRDEIPVTTDDNDTKKGRKKLLQATYTPDQRLESWLKVKKDYSTGADSLDLVPIGAWHGQGRKANWWSPILLAVRADPDSPDDDDTAQYIAVCKCISGFTDVFYKDLKVKYSLDPDNPNTFTGPKPEAYDTPLIPDIWFHPLEVWEIRGADITLSPVYRAGLGRVSDDRGMSLRFPRFMGVREDKSVNEASTGGDLAHMYTLQEEGRATLPGPEEED